MFTQDNPSVQSTVINVVLIDSVVIALLLFYFRTHMSSIFIKWLFRWRAGPHFPQSLLIELVHSSGKHGLRSWKAHLW